jgi:hypothetical protein
VAFELTWCSHNSTSNRWNCAATCGACGGPICFRATATQNNNLNSPMGYGGNIEPQWRVEEIWPSRRPTGAPPYTPRGTASRFVQGENAYVRGDWNAALAMYRSALDVATKAMDGVPSGTFFDRLKWLHEQHRITPEIRGWGDHVRIEGNGALQDPDEFSEEDVKPLRLFTQMFLRYAFELPGEVRAFRGETAGAKA